MNARTRILNFLRNPKSFGTSATDADTWRSGLAFAVPSLEAHREHSLREAQVNAWTGLAEARAGLILGPPGTGKTHLLSWLIVGYVHARRQAGLPARVFVTAFTRNAIGNLLDSVALRASVHDPGAFDVHYFGSAPPAGLSPRVEHRSSLYGAEGASALADLRTEAVVMGASVWSLYRLLGRPEAGGDGFTADLFDLVCIDEASQMVLSHGLMAIAGLKENGRLVVAGDDRQLPPIRAGRQVILHERQLGSSLYAFLKTGEVPEFPLEETFRLNGPLAVFPERKFYPGHFRSTVETKRLELVPEWQAELDKFEAAALDPDFPIAVILHEGSPAATSNEFEATLAARFAECLADRMDGAKTGNGYAPDLWHERLAIISPHRAQNLLIRGALPEALRKGAFVETVDRIQGKERDSIILSYCVADAEFALAEADFIFAPERLNVAVTRARTKLILIISRRLLDALPSDQEQMDKAELLREFVFSAAPKGETVLRDVDGTQVRVQLRLLGFHDAPELEDLGTGSPAAVEFPDVLTSELEDLLQAVKAAALASTHGTAKVADLKRRLATGRDLLPGLAQLHTLGHVILDQRSGPHGLFWTARPLDPVRKVFATDLDSVRRHAEEAISQSGGGLLAPFYTIVRRQFAWMNGSGEDGLKPQFDILKGEGLLTYGTANNQLTVKWNDVDAPADECRVEPPVALSDDDYRVLNALEDAEAARIDFGVFEAWTSAAGLADQTRLSRGAVTASFGRLNAAGWIMLAADGRVRSRMAELAREVRYVKQRFRRDDADQRPYLVRSLKVELRDRDKPERREPIDEFFAGLAERVPEVHSKTLLGLSKALCGLWGTDSRFAAFQTRSIAALTQAWGGERGDAFVIAADTGSGKTEAAALAFIAAAAADRLLGTTGTRAILTYPRIRLATNQAQRLTHYLEALAREPGMPTLTLGLQLGQVPETFGTLNERDRQSGWTPIGSNAFAFPFFACPDCEGDLVLNSGAGVSGADQLSCTQCDWSYAGWIGSKEALRENPPALFLPTTDSLHQWLHDRRYGKLFGDDPASAPPRAFVADEIHLYTHVHGAQVGYALRRLTARAESNSASANPMLAVGMSATLGDPVKTWARLIGRDRVSLLAPTADEKLPNPRGREYFFFVQPEVESRGQEIAGASTTIQTLMCLAHGMRRRTGDDGGFRALAFLDSIDKIRRLHAAYDDAETQRRLAAYRTRLFPDDPLTGESRDGCCREPHGCDVFRNGECWFFAATDAAQCGPRGVRKFGVPLKVADQPVFSGATGRIEALIQSSDVVFATSSLEVGYDDPDINLIYQHYAPKNLASFIQRKGRGGRGSDDRPITGVTLSIYSSRDSWWFRKPHEMIEPSGFDVPLNPDNHFVRRGQMLATMLDALARYQYQRQCEIDLQNPPKDALEEAVALACRVFGPDPWREFDQPDLLGLWQRALAVARPNERLRYLTDARAAIDWIPDVLFDTVNVPRLRVRTGADSGRAEDVALTMAMAAPGNATRRYDPVAVYWRPPTNGLSPWLGPDDYAHGRRTRPFGDDAQAWLALLPDDAHPVLEGLSADYFRPAQLSLETLGRMRGTGWQSDWSVPNTDPIAVQRVQNNGQDNRRVRHDSRGSLRGYPVVKASTDRSRVIDSGGISPWVREVEYFLGDGLGGRETGLALARVYWGADAEVLLVGPPAETVVFSQVFTDPESRRPLLHGYHVQTEGVRFKLDANFLDSFVETELARLSQDEHARRWHTGQMLRLLVESKAQAAGVNAYEARRGAELLVSAAADPELKKRLTHLLKFWSAANLETLFEDTRSQILSQHPLLSPKRVKSVAQALSDQRFQGVFGDAVDAISNAEPFGRYIKSVVIHSLAVRLKESFIQVGRADEQQVIMHVQLPIQFSNADEPIVTVCEAGAFGDGTTRSFIARFDESVEHWRDGFIANCPNAREDAAMGRLFEHSSHHEAWRSLDPNDPAALTALAEPLGLTEGAAVPPAVLRVLYGSETVGVENFDLYDLACEIRGIDQQLSRRFGRSPSAWELTSAVVESAKSESTSTPGRIFQAYAHIEAAAQEESLSPAGRLADQVYRLNAPLCVDGCRACVHQGSDLMTESMVEASTSRTLLERFICAAA